MFNQCGIGVPYYYHIRSTFKYKYILKRETYRYFWKLLGRVFYRKVCFLHGGWWYRMVVKSVGWGLRHICVSILTCSAYGFLSK